MIPQSPVLGIDIGGTKIAAGLVQADGTILQSQIAPTPSGGSQPILQTVINLCRPLLALRADVPAIGVGTAGQVDPSSGIITYANQNLPGWQGTSVGEQLKAALGRPVIVDNDVNAMAFGESQIGAGAGYDHILFVTVGTGIGGAWVQNGKLWRGAHFSAGEIGYLVAGWEDGKPVTVEQRASGPGMTAHYRQLSGTNAPITLVEIAALAQNGDATALAVIREGAHILGTVLGSALCLLDPQIVIIGGGVPGIGELWWRPFENALRGIDLPAPQQVQISRARFDTVAVMIGAARLALTLV